MQSRSFLATRRPRLAAIKNHPRLDFADYERRLQTLQATLQLIQQAYLGTSERALLVLEGWDTAGKGGIVRRLGWALDPRSFKVHPIAAPDEHERAQHYLQRFWQRLPEQGQIVTFDRSWYGRVLVERVEGFATAEEWHRAYREINEFEHVLLDSGIRLVKLFLHITPDEQVRRFRERLINPLKRWKLSYEDFRNRRDRGHDPRDLDEGGAVVPDPVQQQALQPGRRDAHFGRSAGQGCIAGTASPRPEAPQAGQAGASAVRGRSAARTHGGKAHHRGQTATGTPVSAGRAHIARPTKLRAFPRAIAGGLVRPSAWARA